MLINERNTVNNIQDSDASHNLYSHTLNDLKFKLTDKSTIKGNGNNIPNENINTNQKSTLAY